MTRAEVHTFLKAGVLAIKPSPEFGRGRVQEFNSLASPDFPYVWQLTDDDNEVDSENTTNGLPLDAINIVLIIAQKDKPDSTNEQYEAIKDECDLIAQKLKYAYDQIVSGYKLVTLTGISRIPFTRQHVAHLVTGVELRFTINAPDLTNNCD